MGYFIYVPTLKPTRHAKMNFHCILWSMPLPTLSPEMEQLHIQHLFLEHLLCANYCARV